MAYESEEAWLRGFCAGEEEAYKLFFERYYQLFAHFATKYVSDFAVCEDIVHDVIMDCYVSRRVFNDMDGFKSFFYVSIKNRCLNYLEHKQAELNYNSVRNKAIKDVSAAYEKFLTAVENLNYYEQKIVKDSEELIEISKNSYEEGKSDITSLIVMKQSYRSIIVGYTYALADYYNSWTNFLREVNDEEFDLPEDDGDNEKL